MTIIVYTLSKHHHHAGHVCQIFIPRNAPSKTTFLDSLHRRTGPKLRRYAAPDHNLASQNEQGAPKMVRVHLKAPNG